jgi:hypothetical protein
LPPVRDAFCGTCGEALDEPAPTPPPPEERQPVQVSVEPEVKPEPGSDVVDPTAHPCAQCGALVAAHLLELRSKTDRTQEGAVSFSRTVGMWLCPNCAKAYDSTGRALLLGLCLLLGGMLLFALFSWLIH